jgi:hypothetical protein
MVPRESRGILFCPGCVLVASLLHPLILGDKLQYEYIEVLEHIVSLSLDMHDTLSDDFSRNDSTFQNG